MICSVIPSETIPGCEFDHSPCTAEIRNEWNYTSIPPFAFMACTGTAL
jgi:hypothetical protein